jgi:hypothetical protein
MAILKIKRLLEDLENNTTQVLGSVTKTSATATLATKATSAAYAGTARVAHFGSSGTGALSGTAASV